MDQAVPSRTVPSYDALLAEQRRRWTSAGLQAAAIVLVAVAAAAGVGLLDFGRLAEGLPSIWQLFTEAMPPDFTHVRKWLGPVLDTLAMSIAGTALAFVLSVPLGFLAASNTTPHRLVYGLARGFLNVMRTIPELIMGILFVAAVGFGPLPGVLALGLHSVGMVGKFFAEIIEHADPAPIEAARAVGARPFQVITHGYLPQVFPKFADVAVYRWEYNFRASTVMGMVGAGGIGFELMGSLRILEYREVSAILVVILVMVTVVDGLGSWFRRKML